MIKQDSYWYLEGEGEGEEATICALCSICAKKLNKGWYWPKEAGYGNYDLFCKSCKNAIYLKGENEVKTDN